MPPLPSPEELEASLWRDLIDRWFPACVDPAGGFRQDFDAEFKPQDDGARGLVFQSRMVWVCATVAEARPAFGEYARHGVRFLKERMDGGLTWSLGGDGKPASDERQAYGVAFAIYGLAATGRLLRDPEALEMAKRLFDYLEKGHYDREHGGYFEASDLSGAARMEGRGNNPIGTPYGQKSQNTHLHLLEAFTELYRAWPAPLVRERLAETLGLFTKQLFAEPGHLTLFVHRDWTPASTDTSYGHDIEAAHLMLDAQDALSSPLGEGRVGVKAEEQDLVLQRARALADHTLAQGWDRVHGGIFYTGDERGPVDRRKNWWAQAEALLGFATLWSHTGDERFAKATAEEWAFIRDHGIDHAHGGWYEDVAEDGAPPVGGRKGHAWKAAYHDGRALLFTARLLRQERPD